MSNLICDWLNYQKIHRDFWIIREKIPDLTLQSYKHATPMINVLNRITISLAFTLRLAQIQSLISRVLSQEMINYKGLIWHHQLILLTLSFWCLNSQNNSFHSRKSLRENLMIILIELWQMIVWSMIILRSSLQSYPNIKSKIKRYFNISKGYKLLIWVSNIREAVIVQSQNFQLLWRVFMIE